MNACLVTGGSGFLGRAVMKRLAAEYRLFATSREERGGASWVRVDLRDSDAFAGSLERINPNIVIHCAAYRDPDFCEVNPDEARRLNVEPAKVLCRRLPPSAKLVFISSDLVFDGEHPPYDEATPRAPVNVYGETKVEAEDAVLARGPNSLVLRIPLLIGTGPTPESSGFISQMIQAVQSGMPMELDNHAIKFPTWTEDVADGIAFLLQKEDAGIFHLSGPRGATRYAWTREMAEIIGCSANHIRPGMIPGLKARRPRDSALSVQRIRNLGFDRFTDFRDVVLQVRRQWREDCRHGDKC